MPGWNIMEKHMKSKVIHSAVSLGLILAFSPAHAQVDTQTGLCTDSACVPRVMTVSGSGAVSTSAAYVAPSNNCVAKTVNNPAVACPTGYSGTMYTTTTTSCPSGRYGPKQLSTSGYNMGGCTGATPPVYYTPPAPLPSCTDADNGNPAFFSSSDPTIEVSYDPSWPANFCDGSSGAYNGAIPSSGAVGSIYQCVSGVKVKKVLAIDGMCNYQWTVIGRWSEMYPAGGPANLQKYIDQFKALHPEAQ